MDFPGANIEREFQPGKALMRGEREHIAVTPEAVVRQFPSWRTGRLLIEGRGLPGYLYLAKSVF
jgi:hypothetical protein